MQPTAVCVPRCLLRMQALRPKLTEEQKEQLLECFDLMDADGSGAIDADEMGAAFKVRGF
jgi:Ca2+-binding EF-hand superfamily protein